MGSATSRIAVTSVKIERDKLDRFKLVAAKNRRTVSQELRWLIDQALVEHDKQEAA